jgi:hypothetical protein
MQNTETNVAEKAQRSLLDKAMFRYFRGGTDRKRDTYVSLRQKLDAKDFATRSETARQSADRAGFTIPRELGFKVFPPATFPEVDEVVKSAEQRIAAIEPEKLTGGKSQLKTGLLDMSTLTLDSPQLRFALREDILAAVANYLGVAPVLAHIDVWYSIHEGGTLKNKHLYHCDWEDTAQVKIFVYGSEVRGDSGPLVVMGADTSKFVRDKLAYTYVGQRQRVTDEEVAALVGEKDQHPVIGPAGTCAFVDTSRCFHYGSRVEAAGTARLVTNFQYLTPYAFELPMDYSKVLPFRHLATPDLSSLQRLALGAEIR